jgi:hypothetical protein
LDGIRDYFVSGEKVPYPIAPLHCLSPVGALLWRTLLARPPPRCDALEEAELTSGTDQLFIDLDSRPSPPPPSSYLSPPPLLTAESGGGLDCVEAVATSLQDFSLVNNNNNNNNNSSSSLSPCQKEQ